ncbi:MAG: hypothetical protein GY815_07150 [Gammaproteobacteria bacterium]|nr:hypothetical protein [Gammaproteobacteria bacterium]
MIDRAAQTEPPINAFAFTWFDEAMQQAREAEAKHARSDSNIRALEGLSIAIKDEMHIDGQPATTGSLYLKDNVSTETHYSVQRLLDAGAIVHARTTTPEFFCSGVTDSRLHGTTHTPWKYGFTCGGSSGGSGASLATGTSPLATGSDIGGSIRIPAACCGVVGYKPPYGRNPDNTAFAFDMYAVVGPMGRTVGDTAMMQNIMCGPYPLDYAGEQPVEDRERYKAAVNEAKQGRLGLWSEANAIPPWAWRRGQRTPNVNPMPTDFQCGSKRYCREMTSCEEAKYYLRQCGRTSLDSDQDGVPCESICK